VLGVLSHFIRDSLIFVGLFSGCLLLPVLYNPRLIVREFPVAFQAIVPPLTPSEKRMLIWLGWPFMSTIVGYPIYAAFGLHARGAGFLDLWAYATGLIFVANLWDWLIIDWLVVCAITPRWLVIPGTEGHPAYKDYWFHFRGFLIGTLASAAWGLGAAAIVMGVGRR
jgi:hypothetical protein